MKKEEFMSELEMHLVGVSKEDKKEILQDYEEHFKVGKKNKRTEAEISKSLGEPKQIAREVRRELSRPSGAEDLKDEAIDIFVAVKKLTKHVFEETRDKMDDISEKFNRNQYGDRKILTWGLGFLAFFFFLAGLNGEGGFFLMLALLVWGGLVFSCVRNKDEGNSKITSSKKRGRKISKKVSPFKLVVSLLFNFFIFLGFWFGVFCFLIGFFLASLAIVFVGLLAIMFAVFGIVSYNNQATIDILLSILFAGIGSSILGILFTFVIEKILKMFFILTRKYIELNSWFIRK